MLRYSILLSLLLLTGAVQAQTAPVITAADMPVAGDTLRLSRASVVLPASAPPLTRSAARRPYPPVAQALLRPILPANTTRGADDA